MADPDCAIDHTTHKAIVKDEPVEVDYDVSRRVHELMKVVGAPHFPASHDALESTIKVEEEAQNFVEVAREPSFPAGYGANTSVPKEEEDADQELNEELIRRVLELRQARRSSSYETGHESRESLAEEETTEASSDYEGFEAAPDMLFEDEENSDDNIVSHVKRNLQ